MTDKPEFKIGQVWKTYGGWFAGIVDIKESGHLMVRHLKDPVNEAREHNEFGKVCTNAPCRGTTAYDLIVGGEKVEIFVKPSALEKPRVIIHFEEGEVTPDYYMIGEVELFIIDENTPNDRVYQYTTKSNNETMDFLLSNDPIGHLGDDRNPGITARVKEFLTGEHRLKIVKDESE